MKKYILNLLESLSNIKWDLIFNLKLLFNKEFKVAIRENHKLKNIHKDKRCFIVGNGPSLKKMDLKKITNEITFSVNNIVNDKDLYNSINSNYHFFIDPLYYSLDNENKEDIETIKIIENVNYASKKPICFINYEGFQAFKKFKFKKDHLNLRYIYAHRVLKEPYLKKIDLSKNMPQSQNVIHTAIYTAIYMGFKEVFLIGCDMTSVFLNFEKNEFGKQEIRKNFHAYNYTESEMKTMLRDSAKFDNEYMLYDYAKTFTIFKRINDYAFNNNIKIYNVGLGGGLDVFERANYNDLF